LGDRRCSPWLDQNDPPPRWGIQVTHSKFEQLLHIRGMIRDENIRRAAGDDLPAG
jgi:hypothetical protein